MQFHSILNEVCCYISHFFEGFPAFPQGAFLRNPHLCKGPFFILLSLLLSCVLLWLTAYLLYMLVGQTSSYLPGVLNDPEESWQLGSELHLGAQRQMWAHCALCT